MSILNEHDTLQGDDNCNATGLKLKLEITIYDYLIHGCLK